MSEYQFQATIKPPAQWRDAPWINIQALDQEELYGYLVNAFPTITQDVPLTQAVAEAYKEYAAALNVVLAGNDNFTQGVPQASFASPAAAPTAPPAGNYVTPPPDPHGPKVLKTGVYKSGRNVGKPWAAYMCQAAQNDPSKCKPVDAVTGESWK